MMPEPTTATVQARRLDAPRWPRVLFRAAATLAAVMLFDQAVFAGQFLSGVYPALAVHRENATLAGLSVIVAFVCAILLARPGRGPWWPTIAYAVVFALIALQIVLGFARALAFHVPLGVTIILAATGMAVWSWMPRWPR